MEGLLPFYKMGAEDSAASKKGIRTALQAILASPHFVFRIERTPRRRGTRRRSTRSPTSDLASRLSFFLWGTPPDDELLEAGNGRAPLTDPAELERQARRLLGDPRASALATRFAAQWLRLQDLEKIHPDALTYPYFDQTLADAMHRETELFFHQHGRRRTAPSWSCSPPTTRFVNERLARHYGITGVTGPEFQRVTYPTEHRRGLLGHGSILTLTSHPDRTSPVLRGKWVLEVLLGTPPPPPPPDVPRLRGDRGR